MNIFKFSILVLTIGIAGISRAQQPVSSNTAQESATKTTNISKGTVARGLVYATLSIADLGLGTLATSVLYDNFVKGLCGNCDVSFGTEQCSHTFTWKDKLLALGFTTAFFGTSMLFAYKTFRTFKPKIEDEVKIADKNSRKIAALPMLKAASCLVLELIFMIPAAFYAKTLANSSHHKRVVNGFFLTLMLTNIFALTEKDQFLKDLEIIFKNIHDKEKIVCMK